MNTLMIIPDVPVWRHGERLVFDRKFYDGMLKYIELWAGDIACVIRETNADMPQFGKISKNISDIPFHCKVLPFDGCITKKDMEGASVVLVSGDSFINFNVSRLCESLKVPCVYVIEYIPETRYQIESLNTDNLIILLRRYFYLWNGERKRRLAFKLANGLQTNGVPAFEEYSDYPNKLLYFDSRVKKENYITQSELQKRLCYLNKNKPLRISFSGRLERMKGADHLIVLAKKLMAVGLPFEMSIFGAGDLEKEMKQEILLFRLEDNVDMRGVVDFDKELLPSIKNYTDVFVCLHRQSDPSCTYLETLSCGVPILGYNNKAFQGILEHADIGWGVDLDNIDGIVDTLMHLHENRVEIVAKAQAASEFSGDHDFESTFKKRVEHLETLV